MQNPRSRWPQPNTAFLSVLILLLISTTVWGWIVARAQSEPQTPSSAISSTVTTTVYLPLVQGDSTVQASARVLQDIPRLGLIYTGLEVDPTGACRSMLRVTGTNYCTHGPDLPPAGIDITQNTPPLANTESAEAVTAVCDGDGVTGNRIQVLYVRASDRADRYNQYLASIRQWADDVDSIYYNSAVETGGVRHVRFVHNANCEVIVNNVVISSGADDTFSATIDAVDALGYNRSDRKYMMFVDANIYCGIGGIWDDDRPQQTNQNNFGPSYGRSDNGCWNGHTAGHELGHNLGAVQLSAPNSSGGYHCVDEYDVMCYSDSPNYPPMRYECPNSSHDNRLDCNHDDYYHTNPPAGSYLATHWNVANNKFLNGLADPPDPDDDRTLVSGQTLNGTISPATDQDTYYFNTTKSVAVTIRMDRTNTTLDSYLILYGPNGNEIARNDDSGGTANALIDQITLTQSGRYRIVASSFVGSSTGGYTINLTLGGLNNCTPGANGVVVYENANYSGRCITFTGDDDDFNNDNFNDVASSIRFVGSYATGWEAVLYEHTGFGGNFTTFQTNDPDLNNNAVGNDRGSSIIIRPIGGNNFAFGRPSFATTQQSASTSAAKGNDGSNNTRWASRNNAAGDQWWWVDLGNQTFDNVTLRWQAAYATSYFVGWSNDGVNFTGFWYSRSAVGNYTHALGTRTARYVGILMRSRAPRKKNYSFWEAGVYRTAALSPAEAAQLAATTTELLPEGELVTLTATQDLLAIMSEQTAKAATATATFAATSVEAGAAPLLAGTLGDLQVSAQLPVNKSSAALTAELVATDVETLPDGYAPVGDSFTVQLAGTDGTALAQPIQLTLDYAAASDTLDQDAELSLQTWNAEAARWEMVPATVNRADQTITAVIKSSTTVALWQTESAPANLFYLPNVQR